MSALTETSSVLNEVTKVFDPKEDLATVAKVDALYAKAKSTAEDKEAKSIELIRALTASLEKHKEALSCPTEAAELTKAREQLEREKAALTEANNVLSDEYKQVQAKVRCRRGSGRCCASAALPGLCLLQGLVC